MNTLRKNLYDRIGGAPIVESLVIGLYSRVIEDPLLVPFFEGMDVLSVMKSQRNFLTRTLDGPSPGMEHILRAAHAPLVARGLSDVHFDALKAHFLSVCFELGMRRSLIDECLDFIESTRDPVLGR